MFAVRESRRGTAGTVDIAFTDRFGGRSGGPFASLDLSASAPGRAEEIARNLAALASAFGVARFARMRQVHGADVRIVDVNDVRRMNAGAPVVDAPVPIEPSDGLVTDQPGVALCVLAADCAPVVLCDADAGVVAVAHAGRQGVVAGIIAATTAAMRDLGATRIDAFVGPSICSGCYEVPAAMREEVASVEPAAFSTTRWGTPSVDVPGAVTSQLRVAGCQVTDLARCTMESADLYSYRRDGANAGRHAGIVVRRRDDA